MSQTLENILKHWNGEFPKLNGVDGSFLSPVALPFNIEEFCLANDSLITQLQSKLAAMETKQKEHRDEIQGLRAELGLQAQAHQVVAMRKLTADNARLKEDVRVQIEKRTITDLENTQLREALEEIAKTRDYITSEDGFRYFDNPTEAAEIAAKALASTKEE